jgi:hypothetical protein
MERGEVNRAALAADEEVVEVLGRPDTTGPGRGEKPARTVARRRVARGQIVRTLPPPAPRPSQAPDLAARLRGLLAGSGVHLLDHRRVPGSASAVDHVAVGPQGVTVIATECLDGKVRVHEGRLRVEGHDRTGVVERVRRQVEIIRLGLGTSRDVPVSGAICWTAANGLPRIRRLVLDGIAIASPLALAHDLGRPGPVRPARAQTILQVLDYRLPLGR